MKPLQRLQQAITPLHRASTTILHPPKHYQSLPLTTIFRSTRRNPLPTAPRLPQHHHRPYSNLRKPPPYNPTPQLQSPQPSLTLSARLRKLSREYGWSAFGVYMLLSLLDFPFCFAAVRYLGADRVGRYEHVVLEWLRSVVPEGVRERWREVRRMGVGKREAGEKGRGEAYGVVEGGVGVVGYDHGVKEAERDNQSDNASIWTQLALAYAIHKSFIFIRVPLTAAVTPKVVQTLRGWGWDIGKRRPKGAS